MFNFAIVGHESRSLQVKELAFISSTDISYQYKYPQILHLHFTETVGRVIP